MEYTVGELLDRYSIEYRKWLYGSVESTKLLSTIFDDLLKKFGETNGRIICASLEIGVVNAEIASLEWAIREAKTLTLEEIGKRALAIRHLNGKRVKAKNEAARLSGQDIAPKFVGKDGVTADEWSKHQQPLNYDA